MKGSHYAIAIHAGAAESWIGDETSEQSTTRLLNSLLLDAEARLAAGASAVDVVTDVVAILEDYPEFNAGRGSALNIDGFHELEAAVVDGATSEYRAVASLRRTKNPVRLARALLPKQVPALLVGKTADELAEKMGLEVVENSYFTTEKREKYWRANVHKARSLPEDHGTAGCVVLDAHGSLAAANTTGGMTFKPAGRIGDTAILGAGIWADEKVAVACSGTGEAILKSGVAGKVAAEVSGGGVLDEAVRKAILGSAERFPQSSCGVISVSVDGAVCIRNNSRLFVAASASSLPPKPHIAGVLPSSFPLLNQHVVYQDSMVRAGLAKYPVVPNQLAVELRPGVQLPSLDLVPFLIFFRTLFHVVGALHEHVGPVRCGFVMGGDSAGFVFPVNSKKPSTGLEREKKGATVAAWKVCPDGGEAPTAAVSPKRSAAPPDSEDSAEVHKATNLDEGHVMEASFRTSPRKTLSQVRVLGRKPGHEPLLHLPLSEYLGFLAATWKALRLVSTEYDIPLPSLRLEVVPDCPRGAEIKIMPPSSTRSHFPRAVPYYQQWPGFMTVESGTMAQDLDTFDLLAAQLRRRVNLRLDRAMDDGPAKRADNDDGFGQHGCPREAVALLYDVLLP